MDGVMPIDGSYSINYVGYGTSFGSFFHGSMSNLRLYESALDLQSIRAIFSGNRCCSLYFSGGTYIDNSKPCTGQTAYDTEFCRTCKTDCGPLNYIENEDNVCTGKRTSDQTLCKACSKCSSDQYMNRTCSGTSFQDESTCPPCRYRSLQDCPEGKVMIGR
jgi:hypothetical protein